MRRVFTHLNSRLANDSFFIHGRKAFFLEDPDCPTLVEMSSKLLVVEEQKCVRPTPQ